MRLTSPKDNQRPNGRFGIELTATATAVGSTISRVDYYVGGVLVGSGAGANYRFVWVPTVSGPFELTVVAVDSNGNTAGSRTVPVTVEHVGTFAGAGERDVCGAAAG